MQPDFNPKSLIVPIAVAEGASTLVSLGAVLAMARCGSVIDPVRDFVARHFIYPMTAHKFAPANIDTNDPLYEKARDQANILVKGGVMVGAGFASHVPIQLALEGHYDVKSFHQVAMGKSAGLGVALGSIVLLNTLAPKVLTALQKAVCPILAPYLPQGCDHGCTYAKEACQLMTVEIPSSIISGLVNYAITRRALRSV